jgi:hypothetical protein
VRADEKLTAFVELELAISRWRRIVIDEQVRFFQNWRCLTDLNQTEPSRPAKVLRLFRTRKLKL